MSQPQVTLIYLLYHAEKNVQKLIQSATRQVHPDFAQASDWLQVLIMDDASRDQTSQRVQEELQKLGNPKNFRWIRNEKNLGLSKTLNRAIDEVQTPYLLTCHCDVEMVEPTYIATLLEKMKRHPEAAAITGQPTLPQAHPIDFAEKVNLVANLMDLFPADTDSSEGLIPVGFAEGRCDLFRKQALLEVGKYETELRVAGEDQVLAARLRARGYEIYQMPQAKYALSVSEEQNSLLKLLRHQELFGRAHPYILMLQRGALKGAQGKVAGANRNLRFWLRITQLIFAPAYLFVLPLLFIYGGGIWGLGCLFFILAIKFFIFKRHLFKVKMSFREGVLFFAFQPLLDISYARGLLEGLVLLLDRRPGRVIH